MPDYVTPGLYLETTDNIATLDAVDHVDVAAFIGIARQGPLDTPIKVDSMAHFQATFGGFIPNGYLAYTVKAFFENGGTSCYIVRVTGQDGGDSLQPEDLTGTPGDGSKRRGLATLEQIREVAMIAMPDLMLRAAPVRPFMQQYSLPDPVFSFEQILQVQQAMVAYCEAQQRCMALLDPPVQATGAMLNVAELLAWRQHFQSSYAALYYPHLIVQDQQRLYGQIVRAIPPCGHVAGMFARIEHEKGAFYAPANEALRGIQDVCVHLSQTEHGELNRQNVNYVRVFPGRGVRIYGARTLATESTWRYVNIRRLFILLRRTLEATLQWTVFEPNNDQLRRVLVLTITSLLENLWQKGAFAGATAAEAFYVQCDSRNNPPELADRGQILVEVGVAPSVPAEFVVLHLQRTVDNSNIDTLP